MNCNDKVPTVTVWSAKAQAYAHPADLDGNVW